MGRAASPFAAAVAATASRQMRSGSGVEKFSISEMIPDVIRFLPAMFGVQLLVTFVPTIATFLPGLF